MLLASSFLEIDPIWLGVLIAVGCLLLLGLIEIAFSTGGFLYQLCWRYYEETVAPPVILQRPPLSEANGSNPSAKAVVNGKGASPLPELSEEQQKNKRTSRRFASYKIPVQITEAADAQSQAEPYEGRVLDRSAKGLRLAVPKKIPVGTILSVRNADHASRAPWVQVEVRNCVIKANQWQLGCRFTQPQPANVLVFFG